MPARDEVPAKSLHVGPVQVLTGNSIVKDVFTGNDGTLLLRQPGAGKQVFGQPIVSRLFCAGLPGVGRPPFFLAQIASSYAKPVFISRRSGGFINEVVKPFLAYNFLVE
jgi:hypothetical protein